jgi:hypothetical protein
MRKFVVAAALLGTCLTCTAASSDWLMEGADLSRDGWVRNDTTFNTSNVKDMKLLWKVHLDSTPRQMHNIFNPVVVSGVQTAEGPKEIAVVAGISDDLYGIDVATGQQIWHVHFDSTYVPPPTARPGQGSVLCPGGQTDEPAIGPGASPGSFTLYTVSWDGRLWQINVADGKQVAAPELFMPANGKPQALALYDGTIYTSSAQGCGGTINGFYSFNLATKRASMFNPDGGGLWGRRGVTLAPDGTAYMGTGDGNFYPEKKQLGNATVAVKLDANKQLQLAGYFGTPDANWMHTRDLDINISPVSFDYNGHHFLAGTGKQCKVWLLDRDNLGGQDHRTMLDETGLLCNDDQTWDAQGVWGSMAAWQDSSGNQWVLVPFWGPASRSFHAAIEHGRPTDGGLAAYKVQEKNGKWQLTPAWLSENMHNGEGEVVANGVVFAYATGEDNNQRVPDYAYDNTSPSKVLGGGADPRIQGSTHVTVYAMDGQTGKVLWSSGDQITSFNHFVSITLANGRLYVPTFAGDLYCFGLPGTK